MHIRRITMAGAAVVLTALLAACASTTQDQSPAEGAVLRDTEWVLISLNGNVLIEDTEITLKFEEASLDGSAGCNTYAGSYTASEGNLRLSGVYATEMGCLEPEGILNQEQVYLNALNAAARYRMDGDRLQVHDEAGAQTLTFVAAGGPSSVRVTPPLEPPAPTATASAAATLTRVPPTVTPIPKPPTVTPQELEQPAGSRRYVDEATGVSLVLPESWTVVEPGPPGGVTILQSYPKDKYVGGEAFQPGDSKCDLTIQPPDVSVADVVQQTEPDPSTTIVSDQEIVLQSGQPGRRMELESMGRSLSLLTEINQRTIVLTGFGDFEPFDNIAATLSSSD